MHQRCLTDPTGMGSAGKVRCAHLPNDTAEAACASTAAPRFMPALRGTADAATARPMPTARGAVEDAGGAGAAGAFNRMGADAAAAGPVSLATHAACTAQSRPKLRQAARNMHSPQFSIEIADNRQVGALASFQTNVTLFDAALAM